MLRPLPRVVAGQRVQFDGAEDAIPISACRAVADVPAAVRPQRNLEHARERSKIFKIRRVVRRCNVVRRGIHQRRTDEYWLDRVAAASCRN